MIAIFLLVLLLINPLAYADAIGIAKGEAAPDFKLKSIDGKPVSLSEYKGKITVIIYWRPDQSRSIEALKDSRDVLKRFKGKGVEVISLIPDGETVEGILKIIKDNEVDFPILIDAAKEVFGGYGIRVYPTTVIIARDGKIAHDIPGHPLTYRLILEGYLMYMLGEIDEAKLKAMISPQKEQEDKAMLEAERRYNLALKFTEGGQLAQATEAAKKSIDAKLSFIKPHILLGFLFIEAKDSDNAIEEFNKALKIDPNSHDAKTGLGSALILKGDLAKAIEVLTSAQAANPYPQRGYYELGRAYEIKGDKDKAVEMYKKAIEKIIRKRIIPSGISLCQ
ncbi:MAG: redoxin domain-containing protein [Nitrospirae bacterium]|nr:redoxin domain-containing protein [Nitrospirota bacterium]